jgi:serine/threonine-protein kinase
MDDDTLYTQPAPAGDPLVATVLDGRYRILQLLGRGGMGLVYLADQIATARKVAVKIMLAGVADEDTRLLDFFRQEMRSLAKINHPNVAQIYDAVTTGKTLYIVLEYVEGESLRTRLMQRGRLNTEEAAGILREVCAGLQAAHDNDIIHRDIKPENIMIARGPGNKGQAKILDFGLAILDQMSACRCDTGVGEFAGTPRYMSPEQAMSQKLSPATDIYSLGVVGYEMLTGVNPFVTDTHPIMVAMNHVKLVPKRVRDCVDGIPRYLDKAIMRALAKTPDGRHASAKEFADALAPKSAVPGGPRPAIWDAIARRLKNFFRRA